MRDSIAILARLYPRAWRERYGEEFTALLEDVNPSARTAFNIFTGAIAMQIRNLSYGWIPGISAALAMVAFAAMLVLIPRAYVSAGTLRWNGAAPLTQDNLNFLQQRAELVESPANLINLIVSQNLYPRERTRLSTNEVVEKVRRQVNVEPMSSQGSSVAFTVSFTYPDPHVAQTVTQLLIRDFVQQNLEQASPGSDFPSSLVVLDPAELPSHDTRNIWALATASAFAGLLTLGTLALLRRRALRQV